MSDTKLIRMNTKQLVIAIIVGGAIAGIATESLDNSLITFLVGALWGAFLCIVVEHEWCI